MQYRKLGKYGVKVSEISLGSWLTYGSAYGEDRTEACVKKAYDLGINHFDTADIYGAGQTYPGAAEEVLGKLLQNFQRSSYVLATKTFFPVGDGPNDKGLSRKHIMEQCHASLKRLNTDYVDIFYCHRFDPETPIEETMRALDDLIRQGKILYAGVSEWSGVNIADGVAATKAMNLHPITINQPVYNMFNRYIEKEVMPICEREGMGLAVFSPLAQGVLTGKYKKGQEIPKDSRAADDKISNFVKWMLNDDTLDKVEQLQVVASDHGLSIAQLALAWILAHKAISSVIIGASKPEQIEENVKAVGVHLSPDTMDDIEDILEG